MVEFVRRLVFSVVVGNADMHLNWLLLYPDRRKPVLSPGTLCGDASLIFPTTLSP
jgi:serine/threonine protein kinase HipA of HipAB toxin-antitoxin module